MSTTTANLGLVKPDQGEQYNIDITNANMDSIDAAVGVLQAKTAPTAAPVSLTTVDSDNTKFVTTFAQGIKMGNLAQLDFRIKRTGATIGAGNVVNVAMTVLPAGWRPILVTSCGTTGYGGGADVVINQSGQVDLASLSIDWPSGNEISFSALFLVP